MAPSDFEGVGRSEAPKEKVPKVVRVWLLGGFRVSVGSRTIEQNQWRLRKAAALVKLLSLSPGHRLHREQAIEVLWPEVDRRAASNRLRQTLHAARKTLDPAAGSRYLASADESLVLCPESELWVDVEAFEERAAAARRSEAPVAYRAALDLYGGELLPEDPYEGWAEEHRRRLREMYLSLLRELAHLYEEHGNYEEGIQALRRIIAEEPGNEEAHVTLMGFYALSNRRQEALTQYERLRQALSKQLGTEPSATTRRLRAEIAGGGFPTIGALPTSPSRDESPRAGKHNLPAPRTSFVGRQREIVELKRALSMTRLLTLTGAGGSGKTRLALEAARDLIESYPDGVRLIELAPLSDEELVPKAVAEALEVPERPAQPLADTLAEVLRDREMLLILDNCEHLLEAIARLVDKLLDSCPRLRILATSREALGVEGEVRWVVPPLSVPDPELSVTVEALEGTESTRLFLVRARNRDPYFTFTLENAQVVEQICSTLEGIPLAIELAAARVGTLSLEQISEKLKGSLELLTRGSRTTVPRHRTLKGTLDWSHDLLSEPEQKVFRRLSVLAGGWTLEAAEAVGTGDAVEEREVLDLLSGLVEKSLVVAKIGHEGGVRYRFLEPVRQYALEKLEKSGEGEAAKRAHAQYFLALTEEAEPELLGPREEQWYNRLEEEHDNIRAALSYSLESAEPELGLRLAGSIRLFWHRHGHLREGVRWLDEGLAKGGGESAEARVKALAGIGWLAFGQADLDRMRESATEGLSLSDEAGLGGYHRALFLHLFGIVAWQEGDYEWTMKLAEESLALSREANDMGGMAQALLELGTATVWRAGRQEQARAYYEEGLAISRELGSASLVRSCVNSLGLTYLLQRDLEPAAALAEEAATLSQEAGDRTLLPLPLNNLGWVALLGGDLERAEALHKESLVLSKELGGSLGTFLFLEGLACDAGAKGEAERAARLFGASEALREAMGLPLEPAMRTLEEPYLVGARSQLEEGTWSAAWEEGQKMSMERAIEYALSEEELAPPRPPTPKQPSYDDPSASLTRREEEVATLVAQGLTNRQIASELSISKHTVANHIAKTLKKLGLSSRSQLTAWLAQHSNTSVRRSKRSSPR